VNPEERFKQTLNTVASVKERIPNPYIVLIEGSELMEAEETELYQAGCDEVFHSSLSIREAIIGPNKSVGEVKMILDYVQTIQDPNRFETFSKISGRYYLTDNFSWDRYSIETPLYACDNPEYCQTRFYRFHIKDLAEYTRTLSNSLLNPQFVSGEIDIETYNIFLPFQKDTRIIKGEEGVLGVRGYLAPFGTEVEDFRNDGILYAQCVV
jgi:hypothetical protein